MKTTDKIIVIDLEATCWEEQPPAGQVSEIIEIGMYTWASYGMYDLNMLMKQCKFRNIKYPLNHHHINVKELFAESFGLRKATGMNWALELLKLPLEGTHHRGVDDAKNIAKILDWCLKQ